MCQLDIKPADAAIYSATLDGLGVDTVQDLQHLDLQELVDDVGMKKVHARKVHKRMLLLVEEKEKQ